MEIGTSEPSTTIYNSVISLLRCIYSDDTQSNSASGYVRTNERTMSKQETVSAFHKIWHESVDGTWHKCMYRGVKTLKCPMDMWIYQELINKVKPGLIIETGTCFGGSALFLADQCQLAGKGKVVTIDVRLPKQPVKHNRLTYITGSSVDAGIVTKVGRIAKATPGPVMVILDSDHRADHVIKELRAYAPLVTKGSYLIVEDTDINRAVRFDHGPGPADAVDSFMEANTEFVVDPECEKFYLTFNPGGYLRRVK